MNEIVAYTSKLPDTIDELARFVLVGWEKVNAVRAEIRAIDKLHIAQEIREQKRQEVSILSETLLDAEVRLGELFKAIPTKQGKRTDIQHSNFDVTMSEKSKEEKLNDLGFSKMQANRLETLAENADVVEYVKAEARENADFPTRARVLELVVAQKHQEAMLDDNGDIAAETQLLDDTAYQSDAALDEYEDFLELRVSVYRKLAKINDFINRFEVNDHIMDALRANFDGLLTVESEIRRINDSINKLNKIKMEIQRRTNYVKK